MICFGKLLEDNEYLSKYNLKDNNFIVVHLHNPNETMTIEKKPEERFDTKKGFARFSKLPN